jgi:uncharacterized integral membrane protein
MTRVELKYFLLTFLLPLAVVVLLAQWFLP